MRYLDLDPAQLAAQKCAPIERGSPVLSDEEAARLATGIDPAWQRTANSLIREFRFSSFGAAFGLASRIAILAEGQGHHPEVIVGWGRLDVTWTTDAIGGLSVNDFVMAAKVDRMVSGGLGLKEP